MITTGFALNFVRISLLPCLGPSCGHKSLSQDLVMDVTPMDTANKNKYTTIRVVFKLATLICPKLIEEREHPRRRLSTPEDEL